MSVRLSALLLALIAVPCGAEFSANPLKSPGVSRYEQRQLYQDAIDFIKTGQTTRYRRVQEQLIDYPLYPYLEYMHKIYNIGRQDADSIMGFAEQYPDTPIAEQLIQNWLYNLGQRGQWHKFLAHYRQALSAPKIACQNAYALYKTGQREAAYAAGRDLWLVGHSQPDECDPIFSVLRRDEKITPELAWQRYAMSLTANERSLAKYLMRFLDSNDRKLANNFEMVHLKPENIARTSVFREDHGKNRQIILHGVNKLARVDSGAAFDAFKEYEAIHQFTPVQSANTWEHIGRLLAVDGDPGNRLDQLPIRKADHPALVESWIRLALRRQDWSLALVLINVLPADLQATPRWEFWKARVLMGSSDPADRHAATNIYETLARQRNYYGFLAADVLGQPYDFEDTPVLVDEEQVLSMEATPGIQRALELFVLNELNRARREWYFTTAEFSPVERQIAARVAQKWGWYRHAIHSMIQAESWDDLDIRFPLAYQHDFIASARTADIPLNWSLAVARQESAFMPDARSSAGALGIMQLLPSTASLVAGNKGMNPVSSHDLINPAVNIQLGSAYLGDLLRRFNHNRILATAAYNAGPSRVDKWLDPSLPMDVWIETIPFHETRSYLQNVLIFSAIYGRRLDRSLPMILAHEMADFSARQVTLRDPAADGQPTGGD